MKALETLNSCEKARLLYELFPQEMPKFLDNICQFCVFFNQNKDRYHKAWKNKDITFDRWSNLINETGEILHKHRYEMANNSKLFSDQLFCSDTSIFVIEHITKFAQNFSFNDRFKLMIEILFG